MVDFSRVHKELQECSKDTEKSGIKLQPKSDTLARLIGTIPGPIGTPYEGGIFHLDISLPDDYPFQPPKMQFTTKVWHPNISSQNGAICLDILKNQWSPALTLKTALLSVQALLSAPVADDPQDAVVAQQILMLGDPMSLLSITEQSVHVGNAVSQGLSDICWHCTLLDSNFCKGLISWS